MAGVAKVKGKADRAIAMAMCRTATPMWVQGWAYRLHRVLHSSSIRGKDNLSLLGRLTMYQICLPRLQSQGQAQISYCKRFAKAYLAKAYLAMD